MPRLSFDLKDLAGVFCAALAICLIAYLARDSWARADCRALLRTADFAAAETGEQAPDLAALAARLRAGEGTPDEVACVQRIGLPF